MSFISYIKDQKIINEKELDKANNYLEKTGGRIEQILLNRGLISEEQSIMLISNYWGFKTAFPKLSLTEAQLKEADIDIHFFLKHKWLPLDKDGEKINFVSPTPFSTTINEFLEHENTKFEVFICTDSTFRELEQAAMSNLWSPKELNLNDDFIEDEKLAELAEEAPIVNLVNNLISSSLSRGASDLHLEPYNNLCRVRLRIDGVLQDSEFLPIKLYLPLISRLKILSGMDIAEKRRPQDGKISTTIAATDVDIRVSSAPLAKGESVVLRFLVKQTIKPNLSELGISPDTEKNILTDLLRTNGVILLTGPTGSGKTTSLQSFLTEINNNSVKIITLEDPVEYELEGVCQIQVNNDIGYTFATGLRSIVRQDPDIIMLGEIRDKETAEIAMQSALTGHLVFSTLHTNDAPSSYTRLMDLGVEEFLLNAALISIVAQRLARKLCTHCKKEEADPALLIKKYNLLPIAEKNNIVKMQIMQPVGCEHCNNTGYKGRMAITEYLPNDTEVLQIPKDQNFVSIARKYMETQGYRNLFQDGLYKVLLGQTSIEEIIRVTG